MRRFSPPWTVEATDSGFKVIDANGQTLAYVYGLDDARNAQIAKALTRDEARRIARNIAKLPVFLGQARPDNSLEAENNLSDERHESEDTAPKNRP